MRGRTSLSLFDTSPAHQPDGDLQELNLDVEGSVSPKPIQF
jgi:hypothetical protein